MRQKELNNLITEEKQEYEDYVKQITPTTSVLMNVIRAFIVGGCICLIGQIINNSVLKLGISKEIAAGWTNIVLIGITVLLTGFNIYPKIGKYGGAGALVPITGFANSVVAPAMEFKVEGQVYGIGCKIFNIAGPVILYGIFSSWCLGIVYWALRLANIV